MRIIHIDSDVINKKSEKETLHEAVKNALYRTTNRLHIHVDDSHGVFEIVVDDDAVIPERLKAEEVDDFRFTTRKAQMYLHMEDRE